MQLKAEANTEPRKKFHMLAKLKKALVYADEFFSVCEHEKCDARTKLESQVRSFPYSACNILHILYSLCLLGIYKSI